MPKNPSDSSTPRIWRPHRSAAPTRLVAALLLASLALLVAGCQRSRVPEPASFEPAAQSAVEPDVSSEPVPGEFTATTGLKTIRQSVPHKEVRIGTLLVELTDVGTGPLTDIEGGPALDPQPWSTRLSLRLRVRNVGSEPATVTLSPDWLLVHDGKGHHRPPIGGAEDVVVAGLADQPLSDAGPVTAAARKLEPGGELVVLRSFVVRKDDRTRDLWVVYLLDKQTLVRFRLAPGAKLF